MMRTFLLLLGLGIIFTACQQPQEATHSSAWEEQAARVTIIRDDYGIPHIYGKSDADAVFGMLYAQCEDDFPRVERNYYWALGRLAEVEGEDALYSDLRARLYMTQEEAIAAYEQSPEWLKQLCRAFADGINYYLYTHPEVKPRLLTHFEPWFTMYFFEGSIGGDIESVSTGRIKDFYEGRQLAILASEPFDEPRGSNGIALAGNMTASGNTMLLINPHTSFYFRGESQVVSEEGLNAYGATTWGQFFIYQGFNEHTGWMHTSTFVDFKDDFLETVENRDGILQYQYGNEWRDVQVDTIVLSYAADSGTKSKKFPIYRTHHGPITGMQDGRWIATKLNWEPSEALAQSFLRTKTQNHEEFWEMMTIRRNSSNNTVFADASGNIAYYHGNFIPKRDLSFDYSQPVDGSDPATDWQGMHELEEIVTVVNPPNGWIQNCNSTPFTASGAHSPKKENYPHYMAPDPERYRGVHAISMLDTAKNMTLDKLIALAYEPTLPAFERLVPRLLSAYDQQPDGFQHIRKPIEVMRSWDFKTGEESVAMTIAHFYGGNMYRNGSNPRQLHGMERIEYHVEQATDLELLSIFSQTMEELDSVYGSWNTPWGDVNRFQRLSGDINLNYADSLESTPIGMASAIWGALASFGSRRFDTNKLYGYAGNSFVAVVEFGDRVKAKSLLAGGQSNDPASPHFDDQISLYAAHRFKDVPFYRVDVEKRATSTYHPGEKWK